MIRNTVLDPNRAGKDANDLEIGLRRQVVGQDEAIEQIARVYQIHRTDFLPRDSRSETSFSSAQQVQERRESWRLPRRLCSATPKRSSKSTARNISTVMKSRSWSALLPVTLATGRRIRSFRSKHSTKIIRKR